MGTESYLNHGSFSYGQNPKLKGLVRGRNSLSLKLADVSAAFRNASKENVNNTQSFRTTTALGPRNAGGGEEQLSRGSFKFHMVVGKGGFGKVWIVTSKSSKKYFALKEMSKARIISKKSVHSVMNEKDILCSLQHSFIINIKSSFQDKQNLYLIMDLVSGGDLRFHVCYMRKFTEEQTQFFIACILHALEYIHGRGFLHRDIKPENLVFDEQGYLHVTDFGISRKWNPDNAKDTSGTPGYMSPEVMCRMQHGPESDYYAVGVIAYECMIGKRPYDGKSRKEIRDQILARQERVKPEDRPRGWSLEAIDFINRLIARKPHKRLGVNGIEELVNHPWFRNFNWERLKKKEMTPPFVPNVREVFDYLRTLSEDSIHNTEIQDIDLDSKAVCKMFEGYSFNNSSASLRVRDPERPDKDKGASLAPKKIHCSLSPAPKPMKFSQSPTKLSKNYLSVNLLNIKPRGLSSKLISSKEPSVHWQKHSRSKSYKENVIFDTRNEGNISNRTFNLPFHSRLRNASENFPLSLSKLALNVKY